ncbi:MAG: glycosyltransferase family 4 protein [Magnetococcales bacterium]|nr:glycosyltransferase family 4 protein [Magnetococcales bacterium]
MNGMTKPQRLVFLCPEFTPYHDTLFDALVADGSLVLRVVIMMGPTTTHPFAARDRHLYNWQLADPDAWIDWRLIRTLLAEEPDSWFMVSSYYTPTLLAAMFFLARANRPFLYWTDTPLPQEWLWHDRLPSPRPWWLRLGRRMVLRWIFAHAHRSLVTGQFGVKALHQLGCPTNKSVDFPHWVILGEPPARLRQTVTPPLRTLAGVGQLIYRKGWEIAIQALARARRTHHALRLLLIGDGPERPRLEQTVADLQLGNQVVFLGWKQQQDIMQILSEADALIHPARWEPYGVVVLEAMAAGLAVLGSDATGAAVDRVVPGVSGFIHTVGNVEQLAGQIVQLASDAPLLHRLQQGARQIAEEWPPQRGVDRIKSLILPDTRA